MRCLPRFALICAAALTAAPAIAGCSGEVTGVADRGSYDRAAAVGYVRVLAAPRAGSDGAGELYRGDTVSVWGKRRQWYAVTCVSGGCTSPESGPASPSGWVPGRHLSLSGECP